MDDERFRVGQREDVVVARRVADHVGNELPSRRSPPSTCHPPSAGSSPTMRMSSPAAAAGETRDRLLNVFVCEECRRMALKSQTT